MKNMVSRNSLFRICLQLKDIPWNIAYKEHVIMLIQSLRAQCLIIIEDLIKLNII